ncbi:MAG: hypothetical protein RIA69_13735, partial [Cyclobacteriaceae bacterium]
MKTNNFKQTTNSNTVNLAVWTFGWLIASAIARFGPIFFWDISNTTYSGLAIGLTFVVGIGMILANRRFISGQDELQKKIQLEAMAFALGIGVVGGLCLASLNQANIITKDADIGIVVMIIGIT